MRRIITIILIALVMISMAFMHMSCQKFRYLYAVEELQVDIDWSDLGEKEPSGTSIVFYPVDGQGAYAKEETNEIHNAGIYVMEGVYDVIVFNNTPDEFSSLGFNGIDAFNTFEIYSKDVKSKWYKPNYSGERIARQPEDFAVATIKNLEVTREMIEHSSITIAPKNVVQEAKIKVKVSGIQNARSARGSISGMASSYNVSTKKTGTDDVTFLLENWAPKTDAGSYTEGELTTDFSSLGLVDTYIKRGTNGRYIFKLSVLLVDNKTQVDLEKDITEQILALDWGEGKEILLKLGFSPNKPVVLPDVKPEDGSEGGFEANVEDWGSDEQIDIII